jgi:hypothetical protein
MILTNLKILLKLLLNTFLSLFPSLAQFSFSCWLSLPFSWPKAKQAQAGSSAGSDTTRRTSGGFFYPKNRSVFHLFQCYASFAYILKGIKSFHIPFLAIVFKIHVWLRAGYMPACRFLKRSISEHTLQGTAFSKNDF